MILIMIIIPTMNMIFMILMNLHRGHGVRVALGQILQGAVVPVCATRIIKVSLTIVHDHDGCVHVDIAVSQNESAGLLLETHYKNWVLPVQLSPGAATAGASTS